MKLTTLIALAMLTASTAAAQDTLMAKSPPSLVLAGMELEQDAFQSNTAIWFAVLGTTIGGACLLADQREAGYGILSIGIAVGFSCSINASNHRKRAALYLKGK